MLYTPATNLKSKRGYYGIVTTSSAAGQVLRRIPIPTQTNTAASTNWKQIFIAAKRNWAALGPGGSGNVPVNDIDPQTAWSIVASFYSGILQAGILVDGVMSMGTLIGCASESAFYQMCQTNLASMGFAPAPTPEFTDCKTTSTYTGETKTTSAGSAQLIAGLTDGTFPPGLGCVLDIALNSDDTSGVLLTLSQTGPAVSLAIVPNGGPATYNPDITTTQQSVYFQIYAPWGTPPGSGTAILSVNNPAVTFTIPYTVAAGNTLPLLTTANFAFPNSASCVTLYDLDYNLLGFQLSYAATLSDFSIYPTWRWDADVFPIYQITASAAYTDYYSPPAASTWSPILYTGPNLPLPAALLSAWSMVYGTIPAKGNIKFQITPMDPATGAAGPALSCTGSWAQGTLKGASLSTWTGPIWAWGIGNLWSATQPYETGDYCYYADSDWVALQPSTNVAPSNGAYWSNANPPLWNPAWTYSPGATVTYGSQVWLATENSTGVTPAAGQYWQASPFGNWNSSTQYYTNDLVVYASSDWRALQPSLGVTPAAGPYWINNISLPFVGSSTPGVQTFDAIVTPFNGYSGTITVALAGAQYIGTGYLPTKITIPPGTSATFEPTSITIPPGATKSYKTTVTVTSIPAAQEYSGNLKITGTDSITTRSTTFGANITGNVSPTLPDNYLSIEPSSLALTMPPAGTAYLDIFLFNTGPDFLSVTLQASSTNTAAAFSFDNISPNVNPGSPTVPGYARIRMEILLALTAVTPGQQILIALSAGTNSTSGGLTLTTDDTDMCSASISPEIIGWTGAGSYTTELTLTNPSSTSQTFTLGGAPLGSGVTTAFGTNPLTVPAAAGGIPGAASTTVTYTFPGTYTSAPGPVPVTATADGSEIVQYFNIAP